VRYDTPTEVESYLNSFADRGHTTLDTARTYSVHAEGSSEPRIGAVQARKRFTIDTKVVSGGVDHPHSRELIAKSIEDSLAALKVPQVDVEYLHWPDRSTPFEETCEAMDKAYREGKFRRFGLSNYSASDVEEIVSICEKRGFVSPSVYQGQYNPIARNVEEELFPVLRRHGIAFHAYG
jgi:aflatoxin B1 aldehyde reductase